jgi:hypothetical protein
MNATTSMNALRQVALLTAAAAVVSCSSALPGHTFVGVVTTTSPRLCLGGPHASGDCFVATASQLAAQRVGQCLKITYVALSGLATRGRVVTLSPVAKPASSCHS